MKAFVMNLENPRKTIGLTAAAAAVLAFTVILDGINSKDVTNPRAFYVYLAATSMLGVSLITFIASLQIPMTTCSAYQADLIQANRRSAQWTASIGWFCLQILALTLTYNLCLRVGPAAVGLLAGSAIMLSFWGLAAMVLETGVKVRHCRRLIRLYFP